ncbi:MAG: histidine phosphatase family protein [Anaerolineales bacterium]|nr:histidine phosphatase family protein [Anaerolineales bacterium]
MTILYLIRHARSAWNAEGRWQGQADPILDDVGHAQAAALAHFLRREPLIAVYSSPQQRARQTAEVVAAEHGLAVRFDDRLKERDVGAWSGLTEAEVRARFPNDFTPTWWVQGPPGGESQNTVIARAAAVFAEIVTAQPDGAHVAVVSHGGILNAYLRHVLGVPLAHPVAFRFDNTSIARLRIWPDRAQLLSLGETTHLASLPKPVPGGQAV